MSEFERYFTAIEEIKDYCCHNEKCDKCMFKNAPFCGVAHNPKCWKLNPNRQDYIFTQN